MSIFRRRLRTPTVLQMEASECGAAALGIILAHHKLYIPLETLRVACSVSRNGTNAYNIIQAAGTYGMDARGVQIDDIQTLKELTFPFIVFWEFNHFVVVEGIEKETYYINDPATGHRVLTEDEFSAAFTGVALIIEPRVNFKPGGEKPSLLKSLQLRFAGSESDLLYIFLVSLALIVPNLAVAGLTKIFIDNILLSEIRGWVVPVLASLVIIAIFLGLLTWLQQYYLLRFRVRLLLSSSVTFLWHLLALPIAFFQQRFAGDVTERVNTNDQVAILLSNELSTALVSLSTIIFYGVIMAVLNWQLTIVAVVFSVGAFLLLFFVSQRLADANRNFLQQQGRLLGVEMSGLQIIEDLKASGRENEFFLNWASMHAKTISFQHEMGHFNRLLTVVSRLLKNVSMAIILGLGSWLIIQGELTLGSLIAFLMLFSNFNEPLFNILSFSGSLQTIRGNLYRLDDINNHPVDSRFSVETPEDTNLISPNIELKDVTFGYSPLDTPILNSVNLTVQAGERVAIIGKTGSGKSTFLKLLSGLYLPLTGIISIGETKLTNISQAALAKIMSVVDQDVFLYVGTFLDNLTLWREDIPLSDVRAAISDACIQDLIDQRGGLNAKIEEGGRNLSGGEKQRLEIARALVTNPKILILDEATVNLDQKTEQIILDRIMKRGCTVIVVTHRLSSIKNFDRVYEIENGILYLKDSNATE